MYTEGGFTYESPSAARPEIDILENYEQTLVNRKNLAAQFREEWKTIQEACVGFSNDYSILDDRYKEVTGVALTASPEEASGHEIPITKTCSIVIPAFNKTAHLEPCLLAIQASSFNNKYPEKLEVIVVDDGSSDEDITANVQRMDIEGLNIKVVHQENGKTTKARYSGALQASGSIVLFTDPDVVYTPTYIEQTMMRHEVLEGVTFFGLKDEIEHSDPHLSPEAIKSGSLNDLSTDFLHQDPRLKGGLLQESNWLKQGGHNVDLPVHDGADWEWKLSGIGWGLSLSMERSTALLAKVGYEQGHGTTRGDDEDLLSRVIAMGNFIVPNTGGLCYHQSHAGGTNSETQQRNLETLDKHLNSKIVELIPTTFSELKPTDARVTWQHQSEQAQFTASPEQSLENREILWGTLRENLRSKQPDAAIAAAEQAATQFPDLLQDAWFQSDLGSAYLLKFDADSRRNAFEHLRTAYELDPENIWIVGSFAEASAARGNYVMASALYEEAFGLEENINRPQHADVFLVFSRNSDQLYRMGVVEMEKSNYPRALFLLNAAIAKGGDFWGIQFDKGVVLANMGCFQEAIQEIEAVINNNPRNTHAYSRLGIIYEKIGDKNKAIEMYEKARKVSSISELNSEAEQGLYRLKR
jgi:tetratricopeptide (TPR) repeat protein